MSKKTIITLGVIVSAFACQAITPDEIDLLINDIAKSSTAYASAQNRLNAVIANEKTSTNLDDPEVSVEQMWGARHIGNKLTLGVSQSFDWPGAYTARKQASRMAVNEAYAQFAVDNAQLRSDIIDILAEIAAANSRYLILNEMHVNFDSLQAAYNRQFEKGECTILDVKKLKIEHLALRAKVNETLRQRDSQTAALSAYTDNPELLAMANMITLDELSQWIEPAIAGVNAADAPQTLLSQASDITSQRRITVAKREAFPSISLGYVYNLESGDLYNGVSGSISLPIFSTRGKVAAAKAEAALSLAQSMEQADQINAEIQTAMSQIVPLREQLDEYRQVLGDSEWQRLLKLALTGGEMDLLQYIQEVNYLLDAQLAQTDVQAQLVQTYASLIKYR